MKNIVFVIVFLLIIAIVSADGDHDFTEAKEIIAKQTPCSELTDEQLEKIGDYYMEQMHPGEAHEAMDKMMGGEGSAQLKQVHINMAKNLYCKDGSAMPMGMMSMMSTQGGSMMKQRYGLMGGGMMGGSMMSYGTGALLLWWVYQILFIVILVLIIAWLWNVVQNQKRRK
ncbi:MAG: hypothetical protein QW331_00855 [Candidatus Woesearchaeota archaeon]